ncbi:MAG: hypothetical protein KatS3mg105_5052 [Gemmatales bacterium]|nr:MAG: hypothetical protein KatS3mg105_5052 [Gemmatales bacterium]
MAKRPRDLGTRHLRSLETRVMATSKWWDDAKTIPNPNHAEAVEAYEAACKEQAAFDEMKKWMESRGFRINIYPVRWMWDGARHIKVFREAESGFIRFEKIRGETRILEFVSKADAWSSFEKEVETNKEAWPAAAEWIEKNS